MSTPARSTRSTPAGAASEGASDVRPASQAPTAPVVVAGVAPTGESRSHRSVPFVRAPIPEEPAPLVAAPTGAPAMDNLFPPPANAGPPAGGTPRSRRGSAAAVDEPTRPGRYSPWGVSTMVAASGRFARVDVLLPTLVSVQFVDFHVHAVREDTRNTLMAVLEPAPFAEFTRFPDVGGWAECSTSTFGTLFERMLAALAYSGVGTEGEASGHTAYGDAKVQFIKARQTLVRMLSDSSPTLAALNGVFLSRDALERRYALTWVPN